MKLSLVVLNAGNSAGKMIAIPLAQFVIGRDPECNLRPASVLISKRHCALITRNGQVFVRDFDSTNGTFVNDKQITGEVPLTHDDNLKVGPLDFKVVIEGKAAAATPLPGSVPPAAAKKMTPLPPIKTGAPDDDAAALLLALDDETETGSGSVDSMGVPDGSTVMDMPVPVGQPGETAPKEGAAAAKAQTFYKPETKKHQVGAAQDAAKAILAKFGKRGK